MNDNNNDVLLQQAMSELEADTVFMIKLGITPIDKERQCYSGFIRLFAFTMCTHRSDNVFLVFHIYSV